MIPHLTVRPADPSDQTGITNFLSFEYFVHRHLDWRTAIDWLGSQPYYVLESGHRLFSIFACPQDPPGVAWIRLFGVSTAISPLQAYDTFYPVIVEALKPSGKVSLAALGLHEWVATLLRQRGFDCPQEIVVLNWNGDIPGTLLTPPEVRIRPMTRQDLVAATEVDRLSFAPLWQNSLDTMTLALDHSIYATVAEVDHTIVGYQICTGAHHSAHLARLAVHPSLQNHHIGYTLVQNLIRHFAQMGVDQISVNTQSDNRTSLALYQKIGFRLSNERYPVFVKTIG